MNIPERELHSIIAYLYTERDDYRLDLKPNHVRDDIQIVEQWLKKEERAREEQQAGKEEQRQYLVVVRGSMDDQPILLTNNYYEAYRVAEAADLESLERIEEQWGVGIDDIINVAIVTWNYGLPVETELIEHDV